MDVIDRERILRLKIHPWIEQNCKDLDSHSLVKFTCDLNFESQRLLDWNDQFEVTSFEQVQEDYPDMIHGHIREVLERDQFRIFMVFMDPRENPQCSAWGFGIQQVTPELLEQMVYGGFDTPLIAERNDWFKKSKRVKIVTPESQSRFLIISGSKVYSSDLDYEQLLDLYKKFILSQEEIDQLERAFKVCPEAKVHVHVNYCRAYPMIYVQEGSEYRPFEYELPPVRVSPLEGVGKTCLACSNPMNKGELYLMCSKKCKNPKVLHMKCIGGHFFFSRPSYERLDMALHYELDLFTKAVETVGVGLVPDFTYEDSYVADLICSEEGWKPPRKGRVRK
jgi:hypothetical protein